MFKKEKFKEFLRDHNISMCECARRMFVTEGTIRHIIMGIKQPSLWITCQIALMMGCGLEELVEYK